MLERTPIGWTVMIWGLFASASLAVVEPSEPLKQADEPPPLVIVFRDPAAQLREALTLFGESLAAHPAQALVMRRQSQSVTGPGRLPELSKLLEALISLLNPEMVAELDRLDRAILEFGPDPDNHGSVGWRLRIPQDDGTLSDLLLALALTEGSSLVDPNGLVDVLGGAGSPLARLDEPPLRIASSLRALEWAYSPFEPPIPSWSSGTFVVIRGLESPRLQPNSRLLWPDWAQRAIRGMDDLGVTRIEGGLGLHNGTLEARLTITSDDPPQEEHEESSSIVAREWLDLVPEPGLLAVVSTVVRRDGRGQPAFASLLEAIETAILPTTAPPPLPLMTRLTLLGVPAGVNLDRDLWPNLEGLTLMIQRPVEAPIAEARSEFDWILALHAGTEEACQTIRTRVVEPLMDPLDRLGIVKADRIGVVEAGRSLLICGTPTSTVRARAVVVGAIPSIASRWPNDPDRGRFLHRTSQFGLFWPGRLPDLQRLGTTWAVETARIAPIRIQGRETKNGYHLELSWPRLASWIVPLTNTFARSEPPEVLDGEETARSAVRSGSR